jgi:hypothetical protein
MISVIFHRHPQHRIIARQSAIIKFADSEGLIY